MRASIVGPSFAFALLAISGCATQHHPQATVTPKQISAATQVDDKAIASRILALHAASKELRDSCIAVESLYGVVLLSGFASTKEEKSTAQNIASQVAGVKVIHNEIVVGTDASSGNTTAGCHTTPNQSRESKRMSDRKTGSTTTGLSG